MSDNLKIYNQCREVPEEAKKEIEKGKLAGFTEIHPMWRIKKLTEMFGVCGIGWKTKTIKTEYITNKETNETALFINIELYIKIDGEWSDGIEGSGGSMFTKWQNKKVFEGNKHTGWERILVTDDEALKKAKTDAIGSACKMIGIAADVYFSNDRTKYTEINTDNIQKTKTTTKKTTTKKTIDKTDDDRYVNTNELKEYYKEIQSKYLSQEDYLKLETLVKLAFNINSTGNLRKADYDKFMSYIKLNTINDTFTMLNKKIRKQANDTQKKAS